ncbi:MAG TPA: SAM-dependent methyltransferase [Pseudonocardia sp.]
MAEPRPEWATPDLDLSTATLARIYDYQLGGAHNFAVDREFADRIEEQLPGAARTAWQNRHLLRRAVRFCVEQGIDQFLDIGSGIPTQGNVHEVARELNPDVRVVYVDVDPIAVLHSRTLLDGDQRCGVVRADFREPDAILGDPVTRRLIDFDRPVAVLLIYLLHVIPDAAHPAELLARLTARTVPGSYLAITHFGPNFGSPEQIARILEWSRSTTTPVVMRTPEEVKALLGDFEPVPPGIVPLHEWRPDPDSDAARSGGYAVVARKV